MEVFKLQRSVAPSGKVLIYNKSREYYGEVPITKELERLFNDNLKLYVNGKVNRYGFLNIEGVTDIPKPYW